jgi:hypothetical protein
MMITKKKSTKAATILTYVIRVLLLIPCIATAGQLQPSAPPGPTMKTLDEIPPTWSQKLSADKRFVLVLNNEAVLDKETGLVWEKQPNSNQITTFLDAFTTGEATIGGRRGWRLPTIEELESLIDPSQSNPALPPGHPFAINSNDIFWSSTIVPIVLNQTYIMKISNGEVAGASNGGNNTQSGLYSVWRVRGGK